MALEQKDLEAIEHIIYRNADDIAVSISRSFERMEEHIDSAEARLFTRLSEVEDRIEVSRHDLSDQIAQVRGDTRELLADEM